MSILPIINAKELEREVVFDPGKKWRTGKLNKYNLVCRDISLPEEITLVDMTIREGEDTANVCFKAEDKFEIVRNLEEAGVKIMQTGFVGAIDEQYQFTKDLKERGVKLKLWSHNRAYTKEDEWKNEVDRAIDAGVDSITFVNFASESSIAMTPWLKKEDVPERNLQCIQYAKDHGVSAAYLLSSPHQTRLDLVIKCYEAAANAGADVIYVSSGMGDATPETQDFLVRLARDIAGPKTKIGLHNHNDLGLAITNSLAGIKAGAKIVDVSVNGLGHSSGIVPMEEIAVILKVLYGVETGIKLEKVYPLSKLVERFSGVKIPPTKAISGDNYYTHQNDSHIAQILSGTWWQCEIIRPETLGRTRRLEWAYGKLRRGTSGSIAIKIGKMGLTYTNEQFEEVLNEIRERVRRKRAITEEEVENIIRDTLGH